MDGKGWHYLKSVRQLLAASRLSATIEIRSNVACASSLGLVRKNSMVKFITRLLFALRQYNTATRGCVDDSSHSIFGPLKGPKMAQLTFGWPGLHRARRKAARLSGLLRQRFGAMTRCRPCICDPLVIHRVKSDAGAMSDAQT
jgi:hypothetical protein